MAYAPDELKQLWHILPSKYALDEILNSMILPLMQNALKGDLGDRRQHGENFYPPPSIPLQKLNLPLMKKKSLRLCIYRRAFHNFM